MENAADISRPGEVNSKTAFPIGILAYTVFAILVTVIDLTLTFYGPLDLEERIVPFTGWSASGPYIGMDFTRFSGQLRSWAVIRPLISPFIVDRRQIINGGVSAMWVVPPLNVLKDLQAGFRLAAKPPSINQLALEGGKETFTHRIGQYHRMRL
jgi:hypothetical protein